MRDVSPRERTIGDVSVSGDLLITSYGIYALAGCGAPTCVPLRNIDVGVHDGPIVTGPGDAFFVVKAGFGGPNGQVHAYSRTTGARTWSLNFNAVQAELAVDDELLYVANSNVTVPGGSIISLAVADGHLLASSLVTLSSRYRLTAFTPS